MIIGGFSRSISSCAVAGGGAAGLFASYALAKRGCRVQLFEKGQRLGGLLGTRRTELGLVEAAANSLVWTPRLQALCDDIGVELQECQAQEKWILRDGKMRRFPLSLLETSRLLLGMLLIGGETEHPTCQHFAERHLGRAAAEYLIAPMITGIYGAKASSLDLRSVFPWMVPKVGETFLQTMLRRRSDGPRRIVVAKGGMQFFVDALQNYLRERIDIRLGSVLDDLSQHEAVLWCTDAETARLPLRSLGFDLNVEYTPMISVGVFVDGFKGRGLGVLIPPVENRSLLGVLFTSSTFPDRANTGSLLTCMLGGESRADILGLSDTEVEDLLRLELRQLFGNRLECRSFVIHRWPQAIPRYTRVLAEQWSVLHERLQSTPLSLFGNYTGQVSLRGMLDVAMTELA